MCRTTLILALIGLAAAPFDPHPLTPDQVARVETADDGSATVDEAALYALLENAADWSEKEGGAVVPDYDAIRREPETWRGTRCLIEGTVELVMRPQLARPGWEKVQGIVLRINHDMADMRAEDCIIVYVTNPPQWTEWRQEIGLVQERGRPVRLVARFYKTSLYRTKSDAKNDPGSRRYLTFVGRSLGYVQPAYDPQMTPRYFSIFIALGLLALYLIWRAVRVMRSSRRGPRLDEFIQQRREGRRQADREPEEETDMADDLPEDPAQALDTLADQNRPGDR